MVRLGERVREYEALLVVKKSMAQEPCRQRQVRHQHLGFRSHAPPHQPVLDLSSSPAPPRSQDGPVRHVIAKTKTMRIHRVWVASSP